MAPKDTVFLLPAEAVAAIRRDFGQYPPQAVLFCELVPRVLGSGATARRDPHAPEIWIRRAGDKQPRRVSAGRVGEAICRALEAAGDDLDLLAEVCMRVFRCRARVAGSGPDRGIAVETGLDGFSCRLCGRCCRDLDYRHQCTLDDYAVWESTGRTDVMRRAAPIRRDGRLAGYSIWVRPGTRQFEPTCPWLVRGDRPDRWICSIQEIKPAICRQYPGSRKHAQMTGCPGIDPT